MLQYLIWGISFVTLYISLVWLNFLYLNQFGTRKRLPEYLTISVVIPAYNEENNLRETAESVVSVDYPKRKLFIYLVNDGSRDRTKEVAEEIIRDYPDSNITLIDKKNGGKAAALNTALKKIDTELFACVDADSLVDKRALKNLLHHFKEKKNAAVITALKVYKPQRLLEKIQRLEYILSILTRKIRASINTLAMTPGVLSVYRTKVLKEVGGFDKNNMTEDFEIAMRLKYYGYNIQLETDSYTYTKVPKTFRQLKRQRVRWFRGYVYNHLKYKDMFFSKKHRFMGYFQLPLNIISIGILLTIIIIVSYGTITHLAELVQRVFLIKGYLPSLFYIPPLKDIVLGHDVQIMFPIYIGSLGGLYLFYIAHKQVKERFKYLTSIWAYFVIFPYLNFVYWVSSLVQEALRIKRKW